MSRVLQPIPNAQEPVLKLGLSQIGEPSHPMYSAGVKLLVTLGKSQISLEDLETVIVLLLGGVRFVEPFLEEGEMVVGLGQV